MNMATWRTAKKILILLVFSIQSELVAKTAEKIIALSPHSVEMLYEIGAGDRIIGTVEHSDYPEKAKKIPRLGSYVGVQIEKIVALQPDLIVVWKGGNKLADINKLESLGFNLYDSSPKNIKDISHDLIQLGKLTGLSLKAEIIAKSFDKKYQMIKNEYDNKTKVRTFYQLWYDPLRTVGGDSSINSLIQDCRGENIFEDASAPYPVVSLESIVTKNPQVIIIPHHIGSSGGVKSVWDKWPMIDAVKEKRLNLISGDILHRFSPRILDGLSVLCKAIDKAR